MANIVLPVGYSEIVSFYTLPQLDPSGHVTRLWQLHNLCVVGSPFPFTLAWDRSVVITHITIHVKIADLLFATLEDVKAHGFASYLGQAYGGSYCYRPIAGSPGHLSTHAFGAALDFRTTENPHGTAGETLMRDNIAPIFKARGWTWGGDFSTESDPMHFQAASGY